MVYTLNRPTEMEILNRFKLSVPTETFHGNEHAQYQ